MAELYLTQLWFKLKLLSVISHSDIVLEII